MRLQLQLSWIALILGLIWGVHLSYLGHTPPNPLTSALTVGYIVWALYWGIPVAWRWWQDATAYQRAHPAGCTQTAVRYLFTLVVVPVVGLLFGVFGGALYQWGKALWLTRR